MAVTAILVAAGGGPASAGTPAEAAKDVILFEVRRQAFQLAHAANLLRDPTLESLDATERARPDRLLKGLDPVPAAMLAGLWPYSLAQRYFPSVRPAVEPPSAASFFAGVDAELTKLSLVKHAVQLNRYAGTLLGDAKSGQPCFALAGEVSDDQVEGLATELAETLGGDLAAWKAAVPLARDGIAALTGRIAAAFPGRVDAFLAKLEANPGKGKDFEPEIAVPFYELQKRLPETAGVRARLALVQHHVGAACAHMVLDQKPRDPSERVIVLDDAEEEPAPETEAKTPSQESA
jgi:hypothetical protein